MSNGFLIHLKRKVTNTNQGKNIVVDFGSLAQYFHVFGENLFFVKSGVNEHIPQPFVHFRAVMSDSKSQVLIAANRVGVFENLHCAIFSSFLKLSTTI